MNEYGTLMSVSDIMMQYFELYRKQKTDKRKREIANLVSDWIDKAYFYGLIEEGSGLLGKVQTLESENAELKKSIEQISERNLDLEILHKECEAKLEQCEKYQTIFRETNK